MKKSGKNKNLSPGITPQNQASEYKIISREPAHEKTKNFGSRTGPTQSDLYQSHVAVLRLEISDLRRGKQRRWSAVQLLHKLICAFGFDADCWFSDALAQ